MCTTWRASTIGFPWVYTGDLDFGCFTDYIFTSQSIGLYGFSGYGPIFEPFGYGAEFHDWGFFIIFPRDLEMVWTEYLPK